MLIVAAILAIFVYGIIAAMLGTIMPTFTSLTGEQKGYVALAQAMGLVIASVSAGPLIDNKGKKTALVTGLGLITISLFWLPNTGGSYGQLLPTLLLLGLGGGIIVTGANALVSDINPARRGAVLNFLNLFFGLGGLATPFIAANLLNSDTIRLAYTAAILTLITFVLHVVTKMPPPSGERSVQWSQAGTILGRPALWLLSVFMFLYVSAEVGVWNWLVEYLVRQGIEQSRALNILSLGFALGLLIGRMVVAPILVKVSAVNVTLASAVLMALTTYLMLGTSSPTAAGAAVFCAGLAMAPVFPTTLAMVGDAFPKGTATAMGIVITSGWIGLAISSRIIGAIAGEGLDNLRTALLLLPAGSVVMVLVNLALRPQLKAHPKK